MEYVKFTAEVKPGEVKLDEKLNQLRTELYDLGLIGMYDNGMGFGNVSMRKDDGFIITATATGNTRILDAEDYCMITLLDIDRNNVHAIGKKKPSSEAMTHGAVYSANKAVNCVIHIHNKKMWERLLDSGCKKTPKEAEYGTPEIAKAIMDTIDSDKGIIVLHGHKEGIVSYGQNIYSAKQELMQRL